MRMSSLAIASGALVALSGLVHAQTFLYDIRVDITTGFLTGEVYTGQLEYSLDARGESNIDWLVFVFLGVTYREFHDNGWPFYPQVFLNEHGALLTLDFWIGEGGFSDDHGMPAFGFSFGSTFHYQADVTGNDDFGSGQGTQTFTLVPTPGAAAVLGLAGLVGVRRRRA